MLHIQPNFEKVQFYKRLKLDLADQLRILRESLAILGFENKQKITGDLMLKLAEDRFLLTVLGQFGRGKSTLLNAITGREIFPTGVLPITSSITILRYGEKERVVIERENGFLPEEQSLSLLPQYVTEKENPGNIKNIKSVNVEIPIPFLKNGFELVDTPGVGSSIAANSETSYKFLPECDAVIFVTSVETPMTESEMNFLADIYKHAKRIFFVVNKIDLLTAQEVNDALNFIKGKIQEVTGLDSPRIFLLSANQGLQSRLTNNEILYKKSGLKLFEEELATFLSNEKLMDFIGIVCEKTLFLISDLCETQLKIESEQYVSDEKRINALTAMNKAYEKIKMMYSSLSHNLNTDINEVLDLKEKKPKNLNIPMEEKPIDFSSDLKGKDCPVCEHITRITSLLFAQWQYSLATSEDAQLQFASELGFCPTHTWQLVAMTSTRGASIGFNKLAKSVGLRLKQENSIIKNGRYIQNLIHHSRNCRVCKYITQQERDYITNLASELKKKEFRDLYNESQGVCLKHLGMLLDSDLDQDSKTYLMNHTIQCFTIDADDMRSFVLKYDTLLKWQLKSNEKDAYLRTISRIVGSRNAIMPWKID